MSNYRYRRLGQEMNGVECNACGFRLLTDTDGFSFGEHKRIAKKRGWFIGKIRGKWTDLCPKCKEAMEKAKREEWVRSTFGKGEQE